jgi:transposase
MSSRCGIQELMKKSRKVTCSQCQVLLARLARLEAEMAQLREQLAAARKNSSTSSKPPSSDIVKPNPRSDDGNEQKRSIGGQPGHPMHEREPFPTEQITGFHTHLLEACPRCGGTVRQTGPAAKVVQQFDIVRPPLTIDQHTCPEYWCARCQKTCHAPLPLPIERGGLVGLDLTALIAFMKGGCHASFSTIRTFLRDIVGVTLARSTLDKTIKKVSAALEGTYEELLIALPFENVLNIDETGHKNNGQLWWTWCLRADLYTIYKIDAQRSADVLLNLLGEDFAGIIGCDYFSAYRRYMRVVGVKLQFCLAHLIRDVKFLMTLPDEGDRAYGERLRGALKELFSVIHRRENLSAAAFARELTAARDWVLYRGMNDVPPTRRSQNMAKRFGEHGEAYFTFVTTPEVEPTNNLAEQAIRFVVIDRHITQGTRSEAGRQWSERIWTVMATCAQQGRSAYAFLKEAIVNWFNGKGAPSLLPQAATASD